MELAGNPPVPVPAEMGRINLTAIPGATSSATATIYALAADQNGAVSSGVDEATGLPIISLYGGRLEPPPGSLDDLKNWHYRHVSRDLLPYLRSHGVTDDQIDAMLVRAPARILGG